MSKVLSTFVLGLVLGLGLTACGGPPSSLELCHSVCDTQRRCGLFTDANASNCHTGCESKKGSYSDTDANNDKFCKNAGAIRSAQGDCISQDCNKVDPCLTAVDTTCVAK